MYSAISQLESIAAVVIHCRHGSVMMEWFYVITWRIRARADTELGFSAREGGGGGGGGGLSG